jgi:hypothetical protein
MHRGIKIDRLLEIVRTCLTRSESCFGMVFYQGIVDAATPMRHNVTMNIWRTGVRNAGQKQDSRLF